ncbi:uncharacterized protein LOC117115026 [Anneissia japonica]|uniref:uncharacterized protein LOC117115026 n=1 Tax=Anneissia japonica TaxID=1529436 RepID=UPI0014258061|nr:uncharacterized protein LOC117115026 [Anneissia japonica]
MFKMRRATPQLIQEEKRIIWSFCFPTEFEYQVKATITVKEMVSSMSMMNMGAALFLFMCLQQCFLTVSSEYDAPDTNTFDQDTEQEKAAWLTHGGLINKRPWLGGKRSSTSYFTKRDPIRMGGYREMEAKRAFEEWLSEQRRNYEEIPFEQEYYELRKRPMMNGKRNMVNGGP